MQAIKKFNFGALPIAALSVVVWIWLTQNGFGLTADAKAYLYAAESFRKQGEFLTPQGYYTNWTPLFPFLLSFVPVKVLFGMTLLLNLCLLYLLVYQAIQSRFWQTISYLHAALSTIFVMVHFFVWSEALFLTFLLAIVILFLQMLEKENTKIFYALILISNLLCLQRMAGIFFVIALTLLLAYYFFWQKAFVYLVLSSLGLGLWLVRNNFLENKPDFVGNIWAVSMYDSFMGYAESFIKTIFPVFENHLAWLTGFLFIYFSLGLGLSFVKENKAFVLFFLFFFYVSVMLALSMNIPHESDRYAFPAMLFFQILFWKKLSDLDEKRYKLQSKLKYLIVVVVIVYNLFRTYSNVQRWYYSPPLEMYRTILHKFLHIRQAYFANYAHEEPIVLRFELFVSSN